MKFCVGLHAAPARDGHTPIRWLPETGRSVRVRIITHTCDQCFRESYELCAAGGLMFIRRVTRGPSGLKVRESERLVSSQAYPVWLSLLRGQAR